MKTIMKTIGGSRLYGTHTANSDTDYKAVHLPTTRQILLGRRQEVLSTSSGGDNRNGPDDVDVESFELQRYLKLASDMQTIPVEMLFTCPQESSTLWQKIASNKDKILSSNTKPFVGYCKAQAVKYSLRGSRLDTFIKVVEWLEQYEGINAKLEVLDDYILQTEGVKIIPRRQQDGTIIRYLDVYGRQVPVTVKVTEALKIYRKPVDDAGKRAHLAQQADCADWKALYHAVRIAEQGIDLFTKGTITFPNKNVPILMKVRNGEMSMDEVLDYFDSKVELLVDGGYDSPLRDKPDLEWIEELVYITYKQVILGIAY